ncbi:hypothetical protein Salat_0081700 [Sesamum alatum]|uniref:Uncharacterized protein n=1 Tax=Sesamum alatum TaxID=300844 RepID=A0AAE2CWW8_9LAMI|nr:hypothetical protein Salat_0081700 [Sesamum alatum]
MLINKLFGNRKPKTNPLKSAVDHTRALAIPSGPMERGSRALKIVHAGGHAEYYYMAVPAAMIMEKNPSLIVARPDIFRRPWDSVVRPEEILSPGHKYYLVPRRTVKKLRSRMKRTSHAMDDQISSFGSMSLAGNASHHHQQQHKDSMSVSGILVKPGLKVKARDRHVKFFGVETTNNYRKSGSGPVYVPSDGKRCAEKGLKSSHMDEKKRRARNENAWEPSFNAINV